MAGIIWAGRGWRRVFGGGNRRFPLLCPGVKRIFFITGTDTGAGKTVLTALLAHFLRERGVRVAALKPVCSGGREDAVVLQAALAGALTLDEINPWHFRAPFAPLLAARREKKAVKLAQVRDYIRTVQKKYAVTLVEGAGGLLSPLGEGFNSRNLIRAVKATPIIVAPNQLGVVNHLLLTLEALPVQARKATSIVLMSPAKPDAATASNVELLGRFFPRGKIFTLPWFGGRFSPAAVLKKASIKETLAGLVDVE
jgi:dethiobiotin synthetase